MSDDKNKDVHQELESLRDKIQGYDSQLNSIHATLSNLTTSTLGHEKLTEMRLKYAYDYFSLHAQQRTTMFNFFMVVVGLIVTAVAQGFKDGMPNEVQILLLVGGGVISMIFSVLDWRNKQLVDTAEDVLRKLEEQDLFKQFGWVDKHEKIPLAILHRERKEENSAKDSGIPWRRKTKWRKHSLWIPVIQLLIAAGFFSGACFISRSSADQTKATHHVIKFLDATKITVTLQNEPSQLTPPQNEQTCGKPKTIAITNFQPGASALPSHAESALSEVLSITKLCPHSEVEIRGYADSSGRNELNKELSRNRAEEVKKYLLANNILSGKLTVTQTGLLYSTGDQNHATSRRVEVLILAGPVKN